MEPFGWLHVLVQSFGGQRETHLIKELSRIRNEYTFIAEKNFPGKDYLWKSKCFFFCHFLSYIFLNFSNLNLSLLLQSDFVISN